MSQTLKPWLRAANPFIPPRGMAEAQRAARVAAVALAVGAVQSLAGLPTLSQKMAQSSALMMQGGAIPAEDQAMVEGVMTAMTPFVTGSVIVMAGVSVILAVVQWRKMTWLIPAFMLAFSVYGLLTGLGGLAMNPELMAAMREANPSYNPAVMGVNWAIQLLIAILFFVALRGGRLLARLKRAF